MKSLKKQRRIQVIAGAAMALVVAAGLIGYGFSDGINLYRSPSQVVETTPDPDEFFQLGGLVVEGSIVNRDGVEFDFVITDGAYEIPVSYIGRDPRPDLFSEGQGTIAKGWYRNGRFEAREVLAKHDETYMPREVIDTLKATGVWEGDKPNS
ncbi:cytochrome c maturation protein CcmE [Paracoccus sp. (in: a-proteobacteria)]|uniref:cytochrome c maturation protein CcmE n=1 Tax=Paracoccus sp. TaxID=267 RepID=UPI0026E0D27F|nr:cytochrome c maturation protein CcmE [Paracoccus sp. (in: a-proteobacteria)]MDO5646385.1 cytochrome c maturation protein CcmE [Paracoccus sp. (in: a-proteobacteria)]